MNFTKFKALLKPLVYRFKDSQYLWVQADLAHAAGDDSRAASIYRLLSRSRLTSPEAYIYAGLSEQRLRRPDEAISVLETGLNKYPASSSLMEHYVRVCLEHEQIGRAGRRLTSSGVDERHLCETLFVKFPDPNVQANLIAHCLHSGFEDLAEQQLRVLLENCSDNALLWRFADVLLEHQRSDEAKLVYERLAARPAQNPLGLVHSALSEHRLGNSARAADMFEAGIKEYPQATELVDHYANICVQLGQMDRVLRLVAAESGGEEDRQVCEAAFDKFPDSHFQVSLIAHALHRGLPDLAEQKVRVLLENCSDNVLLWTLADVLLHYQRSDEAKLIYKRLAARPAENPLGLVHSALSEHRLGNSARAADMFEAGIKEYPQAAELVDHYILVCSKLGQMERVLRILASDAKTEEQACEVLFEKFPDPQFQVGLIDYCLNSGLIRLGEQKINSIKEFSRNALALWQVAELLLLRERTNEANAIHRKLTEHNLEDAQDYHLSSLAFICLSDLDGCLGRLEQGLLRHPREGKLLTLYMSICAKRLDYKRYLNFLGAPNSQFPAPVSMLDFYRASMSSPVDFVIGLRDIESLFDGHDIATLRGDFIAYLRKNPQPIKIARVLLFFCRYLHLPQDFGDGVYEALQTACEAGSKESQSLLILNEMTPPMIPERPIHGAVIVEKFIRAGLRISKNPVELGEPIADMTNNWTPWQYIFCLVAPKLYGEAIAAIEKMIFNTWPKLDFTAPHVGDAMDLQKRQGKKIRIGFIVHDSMPMMSGFLPRLDRDRFETVFLRPGTAGQSAAAKSWIARADKVVQYSDVDMYAALQVIANEELDIIISGPSIAAVFYPMMARLAPLQMVLLEPNWTDGLTNADYYISWQQAEPVNPADFYKTKAALFQNPPYWIERPAIGENGSISPEARTDTRRRLLNVGPEARLYLCANTPPKIHPDMDDIFFDVLDRDKEAILVLLRGEYPPAQSLRARLRAKLGSLYERVVFVPTMSKDDAHMLLQSVDCCLDSYPLCGMSSSFDGAMLGIATVTLPADIPFGRWTAAIYEYIGIEGLTASSREDYVDIALRIASDKVWRARISAEMKEKSSRYVESQASSDEFQKFLTHSWNRRLEGLPAANWLRGEWK
ncbi:O-linked N-acetylglucosamine transferase family protein [Variovorax ginsengisoli]|uniref:Tetratricopeptide repeat protein n=1 Tax=Variovorax ginsengisoli TaxID=363844 RepID=A0ABT8RZ97_9BURK|nr:tetratricopeptide repeat protein [Variovorax ginsengisoli]MDN8612821.1 tetratricopeptide repeat protein [Variovorax ginsengisoli]MDO1531991.1 tetratricopeptide repeat protein [Variovorax ginsengisoli]